MYIQGFGRPLCWDGTKVVTWFDTTVNTMRHRQTDFGSHGHGELSKQKQRKEIHHRQVKYDTAHRQHPTEATYFRDIVCYFRFNQSGGMVLVPSHFGFIDIGLQRGRGVIRPGSRIVSSDDSHRRKLDRKNVHNSRKTVGG